VSESPPVPGTDCTISLSFPKAGTPRSVVVQPHGSIPHGSMGWGVRGTEAVARLVTPHTERGRRLRVVEYPDVCDTGHAPPFRRGVPTR